MYFVYITYFTGTAEQGGGGGMGAGARAPQYF